MLSDDGIGSGSLGWASSAGSSTSMTVGRQPSSRDRRPVVVTTATGSASPSRNSIRAVGSAGSIGRYAAPVLRTARIETIASAERENSSATRSPGPAPSSISKCANRFAASSSSR